MTERFLDLFGRQPIGLIVRLVVQIVVALKGKQLFSVAFPDHCNVNAPLHPSFQTRKTLVKPGKHGLQQWAVSAILLGMAKLVSKNPNQDAAPHPRGVLSAQLEVNRLTLKPHGHNVIFDVDDLKL